MNILPNKYYSLAEAARLLQIERRSLVVQLKKHKVALLVAGDTKPGTRYLIKGTRLLKFVQKI